MPSLKFKLMIKLQSLCIIWRIIGAYTLERDRNNALYFSSGEHQILSYKSTCPRLRSIPCAPTDRISEEGFTPLRSKITRRSRQRVSTRVRPKRGEHHGRQSYMYNNVLHISTYYIV